VRGKEPTIKPILFIEKLKVIRQTLTAHTAEGVRLRGLIGGERVSSAHRIDS
jgi:hypothetical protein